MTTLRQGRRANGRRRGRHSLGDIFFNVLNYAFFALFTFVCIFPFYYLFINTISDNQLVSLGQITLYPKGIQFENYVQVLKIEGLSQATLTSVARTVLGTIWTVGGSAFLGYLVTKKEMWHRKLFYRLIIITMYFNAGLIPWYMNMRALGFLDNFWAYVIPGLVSPYNVILVKTFIENVPPRWRRARIWTAQATSFAFPRSYCRLSPPSWPRWPSSAPCSSGTALSIPWC